jgi:hypothetical protein
MGSMELELAYALTVEICETMPGAVFKSAPSKQERQRVLNAPSTAIDPKWGKRSGV